MPLDPSSQFATVLFVDDDVDVLTSASLLLAKRGYRMLSARTPAEARSHLAAELVDAILLDLNYSPRATEGDEGLGLLSEILQHDPHAAVVVVTGHSGVNVAVAAMRAGAADFIMKPWSNKRLVATLEDAVERRRSKAGLNARQASREPAAADDPALILGSSPPIQRAKDLVARAAATRAPLLIHGEAGSGKSLIARAIHRQAARPGAPFIVLDLAVLTGTAADEPLFIERDLTDAFKSAQGGDLVLDEVGGLSASFQARLFAFLEARQRTPEHNQVRLISTSAKLRPDPTGAGGLRADLLHQLSTVEIVVPPLRERRDDIPILADHFLRLYADRYDRPARVPSKAAGQILASGAWPGNVRALQQALERAVILTDGPEIAVEDLQFGGTAVESPVSEGPGADTKLTLAHSERGLVEAALKRNRFNVSRAAAELGLTRAALYRRMAKHGF
jgi:DNA-binding NtrC family response regulator